MSDFIKDYKTKDGYLVRVYCIALSQGRMNSSRKHGIRVVMDKIIAERARVADLRSVRPGDGPAEGRIRRLQRGQEGHQAEARRRQEDEAGKQAGGAPRRSGARSPRGSCGLISVTRSRLLHARSWNAPRASLPSPALCTPTEDDTHPETVRHLRAFILCTQAKQAGLFLFEGIRGGVSAA